MHPSFQVFSQCLPGDGESVPVDQLVLQQIMQDHCTRAAKGIGSVKRIKDSNNQREKRKKRLFGYDRNKYGKAGEPNLEKGT